MNHAALLLSALLSLVPSLARTPCIVRNRDAIAAHADAAERERGVPAGVILVVSLLESRFGCDPRSGGCWGAPASARHRRVAGTPDNAARILQHSFEICGDWNSALTRFRSGQCVFRRSLVGYEPSDAVRWIRRAYDRAGLPLPDGMR